MLVLFAVNRCAGKYGTVVSRRPLSNEFMCKACVCPKSINDIARADAIFAHATFIW